MCLSLGLTGIAFCGGEYLSCGSGFSKVAVEISFGLVCAVSCFYFLL